MCCPVLLFCCSVVCSFVFVICCPGKKLFKIEGLFYYWLYANCCNQRAYRVAVSIVVVVFDDCECVMVVKWPLHFAQYTDIL